MSNAVAVTICGATSVKLQPDDGSISVLPVQEMIMSTVAALSGMKSLLIVNVVSDGSLTNLQDSVPFWISVTPSSQVLVAGFVE